MLPRAARKMSTATTTRTTGTSNCRINIATPIDRSCQSRCGWSLASRWRQRCRPVADRLPDRWRVREQRDSEHEQAPSDLGEDYQEWSPDPRSGQRHGEPQERDGPSRRGKRAHRKCRAQTRNIRRQRHHQQASHHGSDDPRHDARPERQPDRGPLVRSRSRPMHRRTCRNHLPVQTNDANGGRRQPREHRRHHEPRSHAQALLRPCYPRCHLCRLSPPRPRPIGNRLRRRVYFPIDQDFVIPCGREPRY
jgi:hypothetical protein